MLRGSLLLAKETCPFVQPAVSASLLDDLPQIDDGNGSMEAFWALRKCQKENAEKEKIEKENTAVSAVTCLILKKAMKHVSVAFFILYKIVTD